MGMYVVCEREACGKRCSVSVCVRACVRVCACVPWLLSCKVLRRVHVADLADSSLPSTPAWWCWAYAYGGTTDPRDVLRFGATAQHRWA